MADSALKAVIECYEEWLRTFGGNTGMDFQHFLRDRLG
jgi:hypothetical protein